MIKNIEKVAELLPGAKIGDKDFTKEAFIEALNSEQEIELVIPDGQFVTPDQLTELKSTVMGGGMKDGVISGAEQIVKAIKRATGLDYEGKVVKNGDVVDFEATVNTLTGELKKKLSSDLKLPEEKKVAELSESLKNLQSKYEQDRKEWEGKVSQYEQQVTRVKKDSYISSITPKSEKFKQQHIMAAFKADGYDVDFENGVAVAILNGKIIKDNLEKPVKFDEIYTNWISQNGFIEKPGGRGAGNNNGHEGTFSNMTEAYRYLRENNIDPTSEQAKEILKKVA